MEVLVWRRDRQLAKALRRADAAMDRHWKSLTELSAALSAAAEKSDAPTSP